MCIHRNLLLFFNLFVPDRTQNAQLAEVMRAGQLDAVVLRNVTDKLDSVLTAKNQHNKQLKHDIARVQKVRVFAWPCGYHATRMRKCWREMHVALSAAFVFSLRLLIIMFRFPLSYCTGA